MGFIEEVWDSVDMNTQWCENVLMLNKKVIKDAALHKDQA
jgi:hypothetical protein